MTIRKTVFNGKEYFEVIKNDTNYEDEIDEDVEDDENDENAEDEEYDEYDDDKLVYINAYGENIFDFHFKNIAGKQIIDRKSINRVRKVFKNREKYPDDFYKNENLDIILLFLTKRQINKFAKEIIKGKINILDLDLANIISSFDKKNINKIIMYAYNQDLLDKIDIYDLLSCLDEKSIKEFIKLYFENDQKIRKLDIIEFISYLNENDIDKIFYYIIKNMPDKIYDMLTLISDKTLKKFIEDCFKGKYPNVDIDKVKPFLSDVSVNIE